MAFIAGPRQVGKTTLAKHLLAKGGMEALYFNWDIESHRKLIIKNPEDFWQRTPVPLLSKSCVSAWTRFTSILGGSDSLKDSMMRLEKRSKYS